MIKEAASLQAPKALHLFVKDDKIEFERTEYKKATNDKGIEGEYICETTYERIRISGGRILLCLNFYGEGTYAVANNELTFNGTLKKGKKFNGKATIDNEKLIVHYEDGDCEYNKCKLWF